jgi:DNA repair protein RadB
MRDTLLWNREATHSKAGEIGTMNKKHYTTGSRNVDKLLGDGFESGTLTQVYGAPGTGKTSLMLQTAIVNAKEGAHVLYIDTDNCSEERYLQILGTSKSPPMSYVRPETLKEQGAAIDKLVETQKHCEDNAKVDLVLIDTLTLLYRLALNDNIHPKHELGKQALTLLELARMYDTAIVVTNQIYKDFNKTKDTLRPLGGYALEHLSKVIIELKKTRKGHGRRTATLRKGNRTWSCTKGKCKFRITEEGIK